MSVRSLLLVLLIAVLVTGVSYAQEAKQKQITPKKVEVDSDFNGTIDRVEKYDETGKVSRVEMDNNGDGVMDEWVIYQNGAPVKSERDTNGDGKADLWITY